jgi:hypothetical protein
VNQGCAVHARWLVASGGGGSRNEAVADLQQVQIDPGVFRIKIGIGHVLQAIAEPQLRLQQVFDP